MEAFQRVASSAAKDGQGHLVTPRHCYGSASGSTGRPRPGQLCVLQADPIASLEIPGDCHLGSLRACSSSDAQAPPAWKPTLPAKQGLASGPALSRPCLLLGRPEPAGGRLQGAFGEEGAEHQVWAGRNPSLIQLDELPERLPLPG